MGWIDRIFGGHQREARPGAAPATLQFAESDGDDEEVVSRNAPRRELVQVILRDTMGQHGIPSDWIECRILSTVDRSGQSGMHVSFVVKQAHERLLHYVFAFQQSFERELARFEPRSREWMLSVGWEFQGYQAGADGMPDPASWSRSSAHAPLSAPGGPGSLGSAGGAAFDRQFAPTTDPLGNEPVKSEDDVQRDLEALFAIRDAAMADTARKPAPRGGDFENTRPFADSGGSGR